MKNVFKYDGWFHNYEYRHLLRTAYDMGQWKNWKSIQWDWFEKKYEQLYSEFKNAGLEVSGFSVEHSRVIEKVFGFKNNEIVKAYHS
jgi:hypothetical protein